MPFKLCYSKPRLVGRISNTNALSLVDTQKEMQELVFPSTFLTVPTNLKFGFHAMT